MDTKIVRCCILMAMVFATFGGALAQALAEFLAGLSVGDRKLGIFRHPAGGWTTAGGALLFLRLHLWHHSYQFRRLRKTLRAQQQATGTACYAPRWIGKACMTKKRGYNWALFLAGHARTLPFARVTFACFCER